MPLRALAFGPLSRGQVQASQQLSYPAAAPAPSGRLADVAAPEGTPAPLERVPESFQRLFPELQEGAGNLADLPGAQPDFLSPTAQDLSGLRSGLGLDRTAISRLGLDPDAFEADWLKAIKAVQQGVKLGKSGKGLVDWLSTGGGAAGGLSALSLAPASVAGLGANAAATGFAPLTAKGLGEALGGAGGASSGVSGLGAAAGGGAALSALLGILASATGDADLQKAAQAAGVGTGLVSLGSTGASLGGLAAGGAAGIGTAAGAAFAPITAALIADQINQWAGGEPVYDFGAMLRPLMGDYWKFAPELGQTLGAERASLDALSQGLPRVQSQQELGALLNAFRGRIGQRVGGYGEGVEPFTIPNLPGAGGSAHEGGQIADFGPQVTQLNQTIQALRPLLPATSATPYDPALYFNVPGLASGTQRIEKVAFPEGPAYGIPEDETLKYRAASAGLWPEPVEAGTPEYQQAMSALGYTSPPPVSAAWQQVGLDRLLQMLAGVGAGG